MLDASPWQVRRQRLAAVARTFGLGCRRCLVVGRWGRRGRCSVRIGVGGCQLREQPGLVRIEAFGLGSVQPAQQLIETLLQPVALVLRLLECVEQLHDHGVADGQITRQGWRCDGICNRVRGANNKVRAHAYSTSTDAKVFTKKAKKERMVLTQCHTYVTAAAAGR